jgi:hypothetical protein
VLTNPNKRVVPNPEVGGTAGVSPVAEAKVIVGVGGAGVVTVQLVLGCSYYQILRALIQRLCVWILHQTSRQNSVCISARWCKHMHMCRSIHT